MIATNTTVHVTSITVHKSNSAAACGPAGTRTSWMPFIAAGRSPDEGFAVSGFCESMNDSGVRVRNASSRLGAASCGARPAIDRT